MYNRYLQHTCGQPAEPPRDSAPPCGEPNDGKQKDSSGLLSSLSRLLGGEEGGLRRLLDDNALLVLLLLLFLLKDDEGGIDRDLLLLAGIFLLLDL
ncbi:MAG TPA: hypothetical protein IAA32_02100 [Candidatus Butyricicoccus stercorigallinarum]|nr:hypothetical protein [Candidatus Butyricicoccus stercorigallinarum]